jgi:hypothetical protein
MRLARCSPTRLAAPRPPPPLLQRRRRRDHLPRQRQPVHSAGGCGPARVKVYLCAGVEGGRAHSAQPVPLQACAPPSAAALRPRLGRIQRRGACGPGGKNADGTLPGGRHCWLVSRGAGAGADQRAATRPARPQAAVLGVDLRQHPRYSFRCARAALDARARAGPACPPAHTRRSARLRLGWQPATRRARALPWHALASCACRPRLI